MKEFINNLIGRLEEVSIPIFDEDTEMESKVIFTDIAKNITNELAESYHMHYEQEIKKKVIDEFAKRLKSDEFQKYNLDMVFETSRDLSYSHCINAFHEYVDEIAEQMKTGGIDG